MSRAGALREALGGAHPRAATKVRDTMDENVQAFVRLAPFVVMASANGAGDCDASPKGGVPGFVRILDERTLLIPDVGGNRLFQSYENFETNPKVGLVFIVPGVDSTARVNGRVEIRDGAELEAMGVQAEVSNPDGNSGLVQGIVVHVDEAYLHCPRSFRFAELWNVARIEENRGLAIRELRARAGLARSG